VPAPRRPCCTSWRSPALALAAAAFSAGRRCPAQLSAVAWTSLLFQIVVVSFASYLLWFWLMRHYPATRLASFTLLTPVFGLAMGALLLGEPITCAPRGGAAGRRRGIVLVNRPPAAQAVRSASMRA
jgi:drug/metabolite transporter (DMT)-like permease